MSLKGFLTSGVGSDKFPLLTLLNASGAVAQPPAYVFFNESKVISGYVYLSESLQ